MLLQAAKGVADCLVPLKEGPVHDSVWAPDGSAFAVVAGFMPAQTLIFDSKCVPHTLVPRTAAGTGQPVTPHAESQCKPWCRQGGSEECNATSCLLNHLARP